MDQCELILNHLKEGKSITARQALIEYGCMRLGSRIHDLRQDGHNIETKMVSAKNKYGKTVSFARYSLKEEE